MTSMGAHCRTPPLVAPAVVRVAAYTRRSVEKAEQEFGSIEAQRESIAAYVTSQKSKGWVLVPAHYDDRNLSGATLDRPGFQRLMKDIDAGLIDAIGVYKFDRLSRNFVDFVQLIRRLETKGITAVSTTEAVDTSTDVGRLILNVLASFAEFTRRQGAERVRHKMLAARQKGMWQGGRPVLGYDSVDKKLVVNAREAADVVTIFETFVRMQSLVDTLRELERRGIRNKSWTGKRKQRIEGQPFIAHTLAHLLGNVLYRAQLVAGDEIVKGEHKAIVPEILWDQAQAIFAEGKVAPGRPERQPWSALLGGILRCARCDSAMVPTYTVKGDRRYGYYQCQRTKAQGAAACRGSRMPQAPIEAALIEQLAALGRDPSLVADAVRAAHVEVEARRTALVQDARRAGAEARRFKTEHADLVAHGADVPELRRKLDELACARDTATQRATEARDEAAALKGRAFDEGDLRRAIESFTPVWEELFPAERARLIRLLVERVDIDANTGEVTAKFRSDGVLQLGGAG